MRQKFSFSFDDNLLAEVGGVSQSSLHSDVETICKAYEAIKPLAKRLGVNPPIPRIAGFCYTHLAALGAEVVYSEEAEPTVLPLIKSSKEIDNLKGRKIFQGTERRRYKIELQRFGIC